MAKPENQIICKNIFKDGQPAAFKETFTDLWIRLIRQQEQNKANLFLSPGRNQNP